MKKSAPIIIQLAIWAGIWSIFVFTGDPTRKPPNSVALDTLRVVVLAVFFNVAYHFLVPLYLSKGKKGLFTGLSALALVASVWLMAEIDTAFWAASDAPPAKLEKMRRYRFVFPSLLGLIVFGAAATVRGFGAFEQKKADEAEANRRRLEAELALLKSQINPHFLLNTLNNLYGIALTEPEKTPDALLKLANMVRYILHECAEPTVPLARDLSFVENFIDLQRLRLPPNAELRVDLPASPPDLPIEPMVLIPFIENAFKHGLTTRQPCSISVSVETGPRSLDLRVENQVFTPKNGPETSGGIGLANTRQRLEQSYPARHSLKIDDDGQRHSVHLQLSL